jgi:hypothetical protein
MVGLNIVVMKSEHKRSAAFQSFSHSAEDVREPLREMDQSAASRSIACQLGASASAGSAEHGAVFHQFSKPNIAKIHEFRVLNISEVWRVRKNRIKRSWGKLQLGRIRAFDSDITRLRRRLSIPGLTYPFALDRNDALPMAIVTYFKWSITVLLGFGVLLNDVEPTTATYWHTGCGIRHPYQVGLCLDKSNRESVHREDVKGLQGHRVVPTQQILISQKIRQICRQGFLDTLIADASY